MKNMQELQAEKREILGKSVKILRRSGFLPAVLCGEGIASQPISLPYTAFERLWRSAGESTLIRLMVADTPHTVLIHDIAHDPLTSRPIHADFYAVRMDKALRVSVPIEFIGESGAVKNEGGVLVKVVHELEIEALPSDLPHTLPIDLSKLSAFGDRIMVKDIPSLKGVKIIAPAGEVIAIVEAPRSEEDLAALNESPVATAAEVKTEAELKKEAQAEEKTTAEETKKKINPSQ